MAIKTAKKDKKLELRIQTRAGATDLKATDPIKRREAENQPSSVAHVSLADRNRDRYSDFIDEQIQNRAGTGVQTVSAARQARQNLLDFGNRLRGNAISADPLTNREGYIHQVNTRRENNAYTGNDLRMMSTQQLMDKKAALEAEDNRAAAEIAAKRKAWENRTAEEKEADNAKVLQAAQDQGRLGILAMEGLPIGRTMYDEPYTLTDANGMQALRKIKSRPEDYEEYEYQYDRAMYDFIHGDGAYEERYDRDFDNLDREVSEMWDRLESGTIAEDFVAAQETYAQTARENAGDFGTVKNAGEIKKVQKEIDQRTRIQEMEKNAPQVSGEYDPSLVSTTWAWVGGDLKEIVQGGEADELYWKINHPGEDLTMGIAEENQTDPQKRIAMHPSDFMDDEQRKKFNQYFLNNDKEGALAYYKGLESTYLMPMYNQAQERVITKMSKNEYAPLMVTERIVSQPIAGISGTIGAGLALLGNEEAKNPDSGYYRQGKINTQIQETRGKVWGRQFADWFGGGDNGMAARIGTMLNGVVYSMADNLVATGAGTALGGAITGNAAGKVAQGAVQFIMSSEATANTMREKLEDGMDPTKAATYAFGDGVIEWFTEKYSVEQLLNPNVKEMLGNKKEFVRYMMKNFTAEGSEEVASDVLGLVFDEAVSAITGTDSEMAARYKELTKSHQRTDAQAKAILAQEFGEKVLQSFVAGGLSGLFMSGARGEYTRLQERSASRSLGADIRSQGNTTTEGKTGEQQLIDVARGMKDPEAQQAGNALAEKAAEGKKITDAEVGRLARTVYEATTEQYQKTVAETVERRVAAQLKDKGVTEGAGEMAEIISKNLMEGSQPTRAEVKVLAKSEGAIALWQSYNTDAALAKGLAAEVRTETEGQRSIIDKIGDLASKRRPGTSAVAADVDKAIAVGKGDTKAAIGALRESRSDLISEEYAEKMQGILEKDARAKESKNFIDDAMKVRLAAMTLAESAPKVSMSEESAQELFQAARTEFDNKDAQRIIRQTAAEPGKGTATFDGAAYGTREWTEKTAGIQEGLRRQMRALGEIATRAGLRVNFINDAARSDINGYEMQNGSITINVASGMEHNMLTTMSHEMTHWLEQNSREGYDQLRSYILRTLRGKGQSVEEMAVRIIDNQNAVLGNMDGEDAQGLDLNGAMAEIVAQSCERLLSSREMISELAQENPGVVKSIRNFVRRFTARIRQALQSMEGERGYDESISRQARALKDETEEIARLWTAARREALGRSTEDGAEAQERTAYSLEERTEEDTQDAQQEGLEVPEMLRYSMVGAKARGGYAEQIARAKEMAAQGVSATEIFRETGALQGFRGNWWVSIDNQNIQLKDGYEKRGGEFSLREALEAPELLRAYPQLGAIRVKPAKLENAYGAYNREQNMIRLERGMMRNEPEKLNVVLRHEIQHAIQGIEGTYGGANLQSWRDVIDKLHMRRASEVDLYDRTVGEIEANVASRGGRDSRRMPTRAQYANAVAIEDYMDEDGNVREPAAGVRYSMAEVSEKDKEYAEAVKNKDLKKATDMLMDKLAHSENIIAFNAPHGYGGQHRDIARMIKNGTPEAIAKAVEAMKDYVPDNAVLIPMPPHEGVVTEDTDTMILARALGEYTGRPVVNALASNPRESRYKAKSENRKGITAEEMGFRQIAEIPEGTIPIFIDNVVGSGETAKAAMNAMGGGITLAYAKGSMSPGIRGLKRAAVTFDKSGKLIPLSQRFDPNIRDVRYSIAEMDEQYMQAVRDGDMEAAQRMVEQAAAEAGYTFVGYHGSQMPTLRYDSIGYGEESDYKNKRLPFTVFRAGQSGGIYVATNRRVSEGFAKNYRDKHPGTVMKLFVKYSNPLVINEHVWTSVPRYYNIPTPTIMKEAGYEQETVGTEEISLFAQGRGYDGVIIEGIREGTDEQTDDYIVFNPEQLKLADPVVYDDQGNVIPLSERFNQEKADIRYSVKELDEQYAQAVNSGDAEAQQRFIDEAAERNGYTIRAYHGTGRADRVGTVFLPERATSGPMAFFTDSREIAEGYARGKNDTSIAYDDEYGDYYNQFRTVIRGKNVPVGKLWNTLDFASRQKITEAAKHITLDDDAEEIIWRDDVQTGLGNFNDYERKLHGWNSIDTLIDSWLESGTLWDREGDFLKVLKMAGIENVTWNDPNARNEKVYDTYLKIQKPFVVSEMYTDEFLDKLQAWWKKQNHSKYEKESQGADFWDKNSITVDEWIDRGREDIKNGWTHNWTQIPDGVSAYLMAEGYDGIKDEGGKLGGQGHTVWILFSSEQIKSADPVTYDDDGNIIPPSERFNPEKKDIRYSVRDMMDLDVKNWMLSMNESSLRTEAEKEILRNFKGLEIGIQLKDKEINDLKAKIAYLETNGKDPDTKKMVQRLKVRLENTIWSKEQKEAKLARIVSSDGYGAMMKEAQRFQDDFLYGRTSAEAQEATLALQKAAERISAEIAETRRVAETLEKKDSVKKAMQLLKQTDTEKAVAKLKRDWHSSWTREQMKPFMDAIVLKMSQGEDITQEVEELAGILVQSDTRKTYEGLEALRGLTITIGHGMLEELKASNSGIRELQTRLAGTGIRLRAAKKVNGAWEASTLEQDIEDLRETYPGMPDFGGEKDALQNFVSWVEGMKQASAQDEFYDEYLADAMAQVMQQAAAAGAVYVPKDKKAQQMILSLVDLIKSLQTETTQAANMLEKIGADVAEMQKQSGKAAGMTSILTTGIGDALEYYNKMAKIAVDEAKRDKNNRIIEQMKSEAAQKLYKANEEWRQLIERDKEARSEIEKNGKTRNQINTVIRRLYKLLKEPKGLKNVPEYMQGLAREVIGTIVESEAAGGRKITRATRQEILEMQRVLKAWEARDGRFNMADLNDAEEAVMSVINSDLMTLYDTLTRWNGEIKGKNRLDTVKKRGEILHEMQEAINEIYTAIRREGTIQVNRREIAVEDQAYKVQQKTGGKKYREWTGKAGSAIRALHGAIVSGNMTPEYFFRAIGNEGLRELWDNYHSAENRNGLELKKAQERIAAIAEEHGYRNWNKDEKITLELEDGTRTVTLGQLMSLYATWKREATLGPEMSRHLTDGGFYAEEDTREGFIGRQEMHKRPVKIRKEEFQSQIAGQLTKEQKEFVDAMVGFMSTDMSELGNEASMAAYGIKMYKESYYFPFQMWDGIKSRKSNEGAGAAAAQDRAFHPSFSKSRVHGANNAIVIGDFMETVADHSTGMINYATMGLANEMMQKVLNAKLEGQSRNTRTVLEEAYGRENMEYLAELQKQLNGGAVRASRSLGDKAISLFRKNAVAGSLSVAFQQPLSYIREAMVINPKFMAQALVKDYWKGAYSEMMDHSGVAVIKDVGKFDMNAGQSAREYLMPEGYETKARKAWEKTTEYATILPELMDKWTWTRMWVAVKAEQHAAHPEMDVKSDEFLDMCGERFNEVMRRTQVYDSTLVRSENMRNDHFWVKSIMSFMAEPTLTLNVLADSVRAAVQGEKGGKTLVAKAVAVFLTSAVMQAAIKAIFSTGRAPDEKKTKAENFMNRFVSNVINEADPVQLIPGYNDLITLMKNGELQDDAMGAIGKIWTSRKGIMNIITGQSKVGVWRDIEDSVGQLTQLFSGLPAKNIMRELRAMYNLLISPDAYADRETSGAVLKYQTLEALANADNLAGVLIQEMGEAGYPTKNTDYYWRIYEAKKRGDEKAAAEMTEFLTAGKGVKEKSIESGIKSAAKADQSASAAETAKFLVDEGTSATDYIKEQLAAEELTAEEARKLMKEAEPEKDADSIWWTVDRIEYKKETGKDAGSGSYYRLKDAMEANKSDEIRRQVKMLTDHGKKKADIKENITKMFKAEYLEAGSSGKIRIRDAIQKAYKALGYTAADVDKIIDGWTKKK